MASLVFYNAFRTDNLSASPAAGVNFAAAGDTIKIALVSASYTGATTTSTDQFFTTPAAFEMANGNGYATGGITLTGNSVSTSGTTVKVILGMSGGLNPTWSQNALGFSTARYAIVYKSTGSNATSPLIGYIDLGSAQGNVNGDFTVGFDQTNGAFTLQ